MKYFLSSIIFLLFVLHSKAQVGIGTTNPQTTFDVSAQNNLGIVSPDDGILTPRVINLSVDGSVNGQLIFLNSDWVDTNGTIGDTSDDILYASGFYFWNVNNTSWTAINTNIEPWFKANTSFPATLNTDNIYTSGQVGIGTNNPLGALHITTTNSRDILFFRFIDQLDDDLDLDLFRSRGTLASPSLLQDNTRIGGLRGQSLTNPSIYAFRPSAEIYFEADGATSSSSSAGKIKLATTPSGTTSTIDRMVIRENGDVGINVQDPNAKLDVNGTFRLTDGTQNRESLLTGDSNGDAAWDKRAITKHVRVFMPNSTDFLVDIEWIEIKGNGTNGELQINNTHPTQSLRYSYNSNNNTNSGNGTLAAGQTTAITVGFVNDIEIIATRLGSPILEDSVLFRGMIISGNVKGFITFDKY